MTRAIPDFNVRIVGCIMPSAFLFLKWLVYL